MTNHPVLRIRLFSDEQSIKVTDRVTIWLLTGFMGCLRFYR
jgi:hypothetical protein